MAFDNRFSLYKLEVFCNVVERGGVGRAADHMFVTQPVVSAHLRSLQEHLGVRLFDREGRGLSLTDAGTSVYEWARDMLAGMREVARALEGAERGLEQAIAIVADPSMGSYVLPRIVGRLRRERSDIRITVEVAPADEALGALRAGAADAAVLIGAGLGDVGGLETELVGHEELVLVCHPDLAPCYADAAALGELPLIASGADTAITAILADADLLVPPASMTFAHAEGVKVAVRERLGAAFLFRASVEHELQLEVLRTLDVGTPLTAPIEVVRRNGAVSSAAGARFVAALRRELAPSDALVTIGPAHGDLPPRLHAA